jgi:hypothetical protein
MFASPQLTDVPTTGGVARCREGSGARGEGDVGHRDPDRRTAALYYASRLASQTGQGLFFAFLVIVTGPADGGALGLGSVMVAMTVAAIALGPFGGAAVDWLGPRRALPTGAFLRFVAMASAITLVAHGDFAWMVAFVYSAASQIFSPAELALVSRFRRQRPAGTHASLFALQFGGQAVGAFVLAPALFWLGGTVAMLAGALVMYGVVVALAAALGSRLHRALVGRIGARRSGVRFGSTLRFIGEEPRALYAIGLLAFIDVMTKCLLIAAPIYFEAELNLARGQVVMLVGAVATGAIVGWAWAGRFVSSARSPLMMRLVLLGALSSTFALTPLGDGLTTLRVYGATTDLYGFLGPLQAGSLAAVPALVILGMTVSMAPIVARSMLSSTAPVDQQGRVFAVEAVLSNVLVVPAILLAALSTDFVSARATVLFVGIVGSALFLVLEYRSLRRSGWSARRREASASNAA